MCKAFEDYKEEGRCEGIIEGSTTRTQQNLKNIIKNLHLTLEQAMDVLEIPEEERRQYLPL